MATTLVTAQVVADEFGVTAETITTWARDGKIPVAKTTLGGHRRFDLVAVRAAVEEFNAERVDKAAS